MWHFEPCSSPQPLNLRAGQVPESPCFFSVGSEILWLPTQSLRSIGKLQERKNQTPAIRASGKNITCPDAQRWPPANYAAGWCMRCISATLKARLASLATFTVWNHWQTQQVFHVLMQRRSEMLLRIQVVIHFIYICCYKSHPWHKVLWAQNIFKTGTNPEPKAASSNPLCLVRICRAGLLKSLRTRDTFSFSSLEIRNWIQTAKEGVKDHFVMLRPPRWFNNSRFVVHLPALQVLRGYEKKQPTSPLPTRFSPKLPSLAPWTKAEPAQSVPYKALLQDVFT